MNYSSNSLWIIVPIQNYFFRRFHLIKFLSVVEWWVLRLLENFQYFSNQFPICCTSDLLLLRQAECYPAEALGSSADFVKLQLYTIPIYKLFLFCSSCSHIVKFEISSKIRCQIPQQLQMANPQYVGKSSKP